ncbi:MAG: SnoaL-like domain [Solirubrobacteraceae bacterium]|jgi:ketosteroid isomerase-like protein|nr:SnoaL-like domain [Solirubrobacteraceae bacterium]
MGEGELDVLRGLHREWHTNRDPEAALAFYAPDIEYEVGFLEGRGQSESRWLHGHAELLAYFREFLEAWADDVSFEVDELHDLGGGRVAIFARMLARGRASGIAVPDTQWVNVLTIRDGLIVRHEDHQDPEAARRELGLEG